ncbi:hypothetical protein HQ545_07925 [Candidatus Woesearchaeota archaeon]|nr:hypothetical protein [Candidatus Woesearchaeota archaeon]
MNGSKIRIFSMLMLLIVGILAVSGVVSALEGEVTRVEVNDVPLNPGLNNAGTSFDRDGTLDILVVFNATDNSSFVEVEAMIAANDFRDRVSDTTSVFEVVAGLDYPKRLSLDLPSRMDSEEVYRLRIYVRDRAGDEIQSEYFLYVNTQTHNVQIKDVDVDPANEVEAGRSLRALVDVKNYGQKDEDDVKVEFSVPQLNLKALPDYMDIESDESKVSEELYLRVPVCTPPGQYTAQVKVTYMDGDEVDVENVNLVVVESDACERADANDAQPSADGAGKVVLTVGSQRQDVTKGEGGAIYPVTFTNSGADSKTFVVGVTGADDWAVAKVSPLQTVTVGSGESKSVFVYVSAKETATVAEHSFSVDVKDAEGNIVRQIPMTANVVEGDGAEKSGGLSRGLEIALLVLVVLLIVVALVVIFTRKKDDDDEEAEDEISGQTYY